MCEPITLAGLALSAVSTGLGYAQQSKVASARDDAMAAERIRQQGLDREAEALNVQSQDRYKDFEGQQEDRGKSLADFFTSQEVAEPQANAALPASSSNITVKEEAKQRGQAREFTDKTGTALGELRSFGDLLGGIGRLQARDAGQIGQIGGFKRGSSNVLAYELDAANNAGKSLGMFGDIVGGLGSVVGSYGASKGGLFGAPKVTGAAPGSVPLPVPRPAGIGGAGSNIYQLY